MGAIIIGIIVGIYVAIGASRLGYSGLVWFVAIIFGGPFTLGLISALPDRQLERKRNSELANLRLELANAQRVAEPNTVVSDGTIGNLKTIRD
jgi:hypothetical protein